MFQTNRVLYSPHHEVRKLLLIHLSVVIPIGTLNHLFQLLILNINSQLSGNLLQIRGTDASGSSDIKQFK